MLKLLPHSGHYIPTQDDYDELIEGWSDAGLDLSEVTHNPLEVARGSFTPICSHLLFLPSVLRRRSAE